MRLAMNSLVWLLTWVWSYVQVKTKESCSMCIAMANYFVALVLSTLNIIANYYVMTVLGLQPKKKRKYLDATKTMEH